jgi:hypothetical protein
MMSELLCFIPAPNNNSSHGNDDPGSGVFMHKHSRSLFFPAPEVYMLTMQGIRNGRRLAGREKNPGFYEKTGPSGK